MYFPMFHTEFESRILAYFEFQGKLQIKPVWNPVTSYLAEDSAGSLASIYARFQQARRHAQGIAELSYAMAPNRRDGPKS
jgi:hypothetical protein